MSTYQIITTNDAARYLRARSSGDDSVRIEDVRRLSGSGDAIAPFVFDELKRKLTELKGQFQDAPLRQRDPLGGRYEALACSIVHSSLAGVDRRVLADSDFWTWLAVDLLSDILEWRFGSFPAPAKKLENYGIGNRSENMFYRLWLRADLGRGVGLNVQDPYEFARIGDQEFWRSHVLRQGYGSVRLLVSSLLKLQSGRLRVNGEAVKPVSAGDNVLGIRLLAKRLKRIRSNLVFEYLRPEQVDSLVLELSSDLERAA